MRRIVFQGILELPQHVTLPIAVKRIGDEFTKCDVDLGYWKKMARANSGFAAEFRIVGDEKFPHTEPETKDSGTGAPGLDPFSVLEQLLNVAKQSNDTKEEVVTSRDFVYWLQGYFEIINATSNRDTNEGSLTCGQVECIKDHLAMVFKHENIKSKGGCNESGGT